MTLKRVLLAGGLLVTLLLTGCGSTPTLDQPSPKEAAEANAELGLRYMMQGNLEVSMEKLKRALDYDSDNVHANHYIAELYSRLGRFEDADRHFRRALSNANDDPNLHNNYGAFLCARGRYEDAEAQFKKALQDPIYRGRLDTMENVGLCYLQKPDLHKAEEYLHQTLSIDPRHPKSLLGMAKIAFYEGKYMSTRAYLQRYLEVAPHTPETLWLGIRTERILGDQNAVASYGLLLKNNFPGSKEAKLYLNTQKP
jgi:type IV pilus assembly protein PilF